jgi:ribosomal protein S18 acetylase RimI-like enzyme
MQIKIRYAEQRDVRRIIEIVNQGFDNVLLDAMIYGCKGIDKYLSYQFKLPQSLSDKVYIVAENSDGVIGFVEFRIYPDMLFLNYIGIDKSSRKNSLASYLLSQSELMIRKKCHKKMQLDVFFDNQVAKNWYEKIGFTSITSSNWLSVSFEAESRLKNSKISGFPQAILCSEKFGFSEFLLSTPIRTYNIGLLGDKWFRVTQSQIFHDPDALSGLKKLSSTRKILALCSDEDLDNIPSHAEHFCRPIRMSISLDKLEREILLKFKDKSNDF